VWARGSRDFVRMRPCRPIYQTLVAGASWSLTSCAIIQAKSGGTGSF
jgi:hypothetical protein